MGSKFDRLRTERERLGFTQAELALRMGQSRKSQGRYESGERAPDWDYLDSFLQIGADISYILTGERSTSPMPLPSAGELPPHLRKRLKDAIEAVEAGLEALDRHAAPAVKAELILAAYDLLAQQGEQATAQIIRLIKSA